VRRSTLVLLTVLSPACTNSLAELVEIAMDAPDLSTGASSSTASSDESTSDPGTTTDAEFTTSDPSSTPGSESESSSDTGPVVADSAGDPPPAWLSLTARPGLVKERGPLMLEAHTTHATAIELRVDGVSRGVFAPVDGIIKHQVSIVFDGQNGEHTVEGVARSPLGEATDQTVFTVDLPPGGQDVAIPWFDQDGGSFNAAFALARHDDLVVTLGALDTGSGRRPVLRKHDADNKQTAFWRLSDWTDRPELVPARNSGFGTGLALNADGEIFLAMNLLVGDDAPRGYLAGLTQQSHTIFPEILLAEGEEIEELVVRGNLIIAVGRKEIEDSRTAAMIWAFDATTGDPAWAPVQIDAPGWDPDQSMPMNARFHGVTFTNDGNLLAAGSTQVSVISQAIQVHTRALLVRVSPTGLQLGEPEVFGDEYFFLQTEALAVTAFTGPNGYCWTGTTRNDAVDPEVMVTDCRGETLLSRFASDWSNSAGLTIAYTPLTGRVLVGGYRHGLHDAVVISFDAGDLPFESNLGWMYAYASPGGGLDRVTALACQIYDCDVLIASDLLGAPQVRISRVNQ
jgi:hypothetical protein